MRILFLADHNWRDTPGLAAVQVEIERISKHQVLICDIHLFQQISQLYKPHLVVINHLHDKNRNRIVDEIRRRGGLCAVLPTEGRPNTLGQLEWAGKGFDTSLCDLYLAWSQAFTKYLSPAVPYTITGCPRFSFYNNPALREEIASFYGLDPNRPIVTVASSFPQAKFSEFAQDFLKQDWDNLGVSKIPGREDPAKVAEADAKALQRFMSWIAACIHEYPDTQFVIKPHPAEDTLPWQAFCAKHNATLMLTDYIWNLLAMSNLHLSRVGCLTAVEAWLVDVESVQLECGGDFIDGPTREGVFAGLSTDNLPDLLEIINNPALDIPRQDSDDYIAEWLGDTTNPVENVAQALIQLLAAKQPQTAFEYTFSDRIQVMQLLANHNRQYDKPQADHLNQFGKTVTQSSVNRWLTEIRGA